MKKKIELMHQQFGKDENHKCCDCSNLVFYRYNRGFYKCKIYGETSSDASDWRLKYVACGMFNKEYTGNPIINIRKHSIKEKGQEPLIDGQMTFLDDTNDEEYQRTIEEMEHCIQYEESYNIEDGSM